MTRRKVAATAAALALCTGVAVAATPSSGTVSQSNPSVTWSGTLAESATAYNAFSGGNDAPCAPPTCDTFALTLADGGLDLTLVGNLDAKASDGSYASIGWRITKPDGSVTFTSGESGDDKAYKFVIKKAAKGDYTIDTVDTFVGSPGDYTAVATLGSGPAPAPSPAPSATPAPTATPGPAPAQDITIAVKAGKATTKSKKLTATVTVSRAVASISAALLKGSKVVASAKAGATTSSAKVALKVKKLKKGSYTLKVVADDGKGTQAATSVKVKVAK